MIRKLSIENFMSIRKEQALSFEATKDKTSHELLTVEIKPGDAVKSYAYTLWG